ncbi:MAG: FKBP-type peptidyl-prolyl cis-trans isomerase [Deltaproteobacteria bacterium]|nr:FKBP-type peptidyl-prolyl cis-trans isomerase [Deltaproteobacteria bacterium]
MKNFILLLIGVLAITACGKSDSTTRKEITREDLLSQTDKASYGMGFDMGKRFHEIGLEINTDVYFKGLRDGLAESSSPLMTEEEIQTTMVALQQDFIKKQQEKREKLALDNKAKGDAFLAENKNKEGVVSLESGLQYKVIQEGTGATPQLKDRVKCNYRGTTIDGVEFDSSFKRNAPAVFGVNRVIQGWTEALQLMKAGSKWELYIPAELAYGEQGSGNNIGPNETLIFEVELLEIEPSK